MFRSGAIWLVLLVFFLGPDCSNANVVTDATSATNTLVTLFFNFGARVLGSSQLQNAFDGSLGFEPATVPITRAYVAQQANTIGAILAKPASQVLALRDEAAAVWSETSVDVNADMSDEDQLEQAGVNADQLRSLNLLYDASLEADVKALNPSDNVRFAASVSTGRSVVTVPQYCVRVGRPLFGPSFDTGHSGDLSKAVLGGMAPYEGDYECLTEEKASRQPSLDPATTLHCLSRAGARVMSCGTASQMAALAVAINVTARLDSAMRGVLSDASATGIGWQRIAHVQSGMQRMFPAILFKQVVLPAYLRVDPRTEPWFNAAVYAPRALVVVLVRCPVLLATMPGTHEKRSSFQDTGAGMDEFDRSGIAMEFLDIFLRSLTASDSVAVVAGSGGSMQVWGCRAEAGCGDPATTAEGLRCVWMLDIRGIS